jgi:hypothetical protein
MLIINWSGLEEMWLQGNKCWSAWNII